MRSSAGVSCLMGILVGVSAACGDDDGGGTPDGAPADGGAPEATVADAGGPDATPPAPDSGPPARDCTRVSRVYVTTSAFADPMAESALVDVESREVTVSATPARDQDHVAVRAGCRVFELLRTLGVVELRELEDPLRVERSWDLSSAGAGNPQDVAWISDSKVYVALLARDELVVLDPARDEPTGTIDLRPLQLPEDTDGHVEATAIAVVGDRAYVLLGRYVIGFPSQFPVPATLAVVDTTRDALVDQDPDQPGIQGIDLQVQDPVAMVHDGPRGRLLVAGPGNYGERDRGGVEAVDLATGRAGGLIVDEDTVGADVTGFRLDGDLAFLVTSDDAFATHVLRFSLPDDSYQEMELGLTNVPLVIAGRDELWVGLFDGVAIHRASTGEALLDAPLAIGAYAPYSLVAIP